MKVKEKTDSFGLDELLPETEKIFSLFVLDMTKGFTLGKYGLQAKKRQIRLAEIIHYKDLQRNPSLISLIIIQINLLMQFYTFYNRKMYIYDKYKLYENVWYVFYYCNIILHNTFSFIKYTSSKSVRGSRNILRSREQLSDDVTKQNYITTSTDSFRYINRPIL